MNVNQLARLVTKHEGLKEPLPIAQVKEVLRVFAELCATDKFVASAFVDYVESKAKPKKKAKPIETRIHKRLAR